MKKQLFSILLAFGIFTIDAVPVRALGNTNRATVSIGNVATFRGRWCFKFVQIGLICVDL